MATWPRPIGNLSPGASSRRLRQGVVMLAMGLVVAVTLGHTGVHQAFLALLFVPFFLAFNSFYQGLFRT